MILAETLTEMQNQEPEGFEQSELTGDIIHNDADHTVGMWSITWTTKTA
jgi:hypothetical protein